MPLFANIRLWFRALVYRFQLRRHKVDEAYLRAAFSELAQMDIGEWLRVTPLVWFKAWGNEVHVRAFLTEAGAKNHNPDGRDLFPNENWVQPAYEFVMKEGLGRRIYVDEWREKTRIVVLEYGAKHETHWWDVYRSGMWVRSTKFIPYLKLLYGEKIKCDSPATSNADFLKQPNLAGK